jgi:hypothetical protein
MNFDLFKITSATGSIWNGHVAFGECLQHFRTILLPNFSSLYQWIWIVHYKLLLASPLGSFRLLPSGDFSEVLQHKTISKPIQSTSATYLYSWSCLMFDCCSSINQNSEHHFLMLQNYFIWMKSSVHQNTLLMN